MSELTILGISGSLRGASHNSALLRAAQKHAPAGIAIDIFEDLREIPYYDQDFDTDTPPQPVADLRRRIIEADGLLIVSPEYNYSIPGVLKNALDWASRPGSGSSLHRKPIALAGTSMSNFGTVRAQLALRQMFLWTDSQLVTKPEVHVFRSQDRFDDAGNLTDDFTISLLQDLLTALAEKIRAA